jgi:AcrR family transcriptional regulator
MPTSKEKIIDAAIEVFFEKGFDAASMREIAEKAGLTKPMIYYHFKNKEGLYLGLLEENLELFCRGLEGLLAEGGDPQSTLCAIIDHFEQTFARGAKVYNIIQREISGNGHYVAMLTERYFSKISLLIAQFMGRGQQLGFIRRELDPQLAEMSLVSILLLFFSQENVFQHMARFVDPNAFSREAFRAHIFKLFTVGLPATETGELL